MRAEIKRLYSPDVFDLPTYQPHEHNNFGFLLQLIVGPKGAAGEESFDILVCTPDWLKAKYGEADIVEGRYRLILFEYNYQRLFKFLQVRCEEAEGETWNAVAAKLGRLGRWEFEDYRPAST